MPKQTLQQFGQSIKAKHPEYKDMDDTALAKAVLAKYPQYGDMVEAEAPATPMNGRTPTGEPEAGDNRNAAQRWLDNLITPDPRREEWQSPARNAVDDFARHVAENAVPLISHPVQSGIGMLKSIGEALAEGHGSPMMIGESLARPLIEHAFEDYQQHGPVRGTTNLIGSGLGAVATGELTGGAGNKLIQAVGPTVSDTLERTGLALGNNALGARGPKPFKYGANPARGAYEEGVLPAMGKHSAAMKTEAALPEVGQRISAGVSAGSDIPASKLYQSVEEPINEARGIIKGAGVGPLKENQLDRLQSSMGNENPGGSKPIYGLSSGLSSSSPEVWNAIRNIDEKTRYNGPLQPEVENLNEVQKGIRSNLRGNLEEAAPDIIQPSRTYSDLKGAQEALDRSMHGGLTFGKLLSVPTFPLESGAGALLYHASQIPAPSRFLLPAAAATTSLLTDRGNQ